ncbi:hypothetical protein NQ318_001485 [Aromia moschata]|uniref:Uncharacterized protein n=1 Tax=Aromia moschata TaxID=1265417 RepID=A0AAV8XCA8_9CUCU|nr:hypothetical protein NQ318_001485 [Aromia moschata]
MFGGALTAERGIGGGGARGSGSSDKQISREDYEYVGQNLGFTNSSRPDIDIVKSIKDLTLLWYEEVAYFNNTWIADTRDRAGNA